jgi:hypothetical protein
LAPVEARDKKSALESILIELDVLYLHKEVLLVQIDHLERETTLQEDMAIIEDVETS